jgi:catechol 2,3-dioxygenase-like lactoylglutathione lyase family enzyme
MSESVEAEGDSTEVIELVRLHHVSFAVRDLARSREFFGNVVGLTELPRPGFSFPGAWFAIGDRQLHLIEEREGGVALTVGERITRSDHMALEVADVGKVREVLDRAGIPYQPGGNEALGFSQVFCSDPDGHTIEFVRYF